MTTVIAAVLSGGRSQRMGADKASIELDGRTLSDWIQRALSDRAVFFVGGEPGGARSIGDAPGSGPAAGLAAALAIGAEAVVLVAVDQPWLRRETVTKLVDRFAGRPVVPLHDGVRQVTCAAYPSELASRAAQVAIEGGPLQAVLDDLEVDEVSPAEWHQWGEDGRSWFGTDTPADLVEGTKRFGSPGGDK